MYILKMPSNDLAKKKYIILYITLVRIDHFIFIVVATVPITCIITSFGRQLTTINIWINFVKTLFINTYILFYILYRTIHNVEADTHVYKFALYLYLHLMKRPLCLETSNAIQISFLDKRYNQILY